MRYISYIIWYISYIIWYISYIIIIIIIIIYHILYDIYLILYDIYHLLILGSYEQRIDPLFEVFDFFPLVNHLAMYP